MPLARYAFIVKGVGYGAETHTASLESPWFLTRVVGVSTVDEAMSVAADLVASGIQLVELCGGFSHDDAEQVQRHVGPDVLIGVVAYSPAQEQRLMTMFAA